jgi:anti-anti-sigma regulatory factor
LSEQDVERALTTVEVAGPVTRAEVARWHDAFSDGLARGLGLRIDLAGSGPWDLAGVQLLLAASASAGRAGRPIVLTGVPDVLATIAGRAGLLDRLAAITEA